MSFALAVDTCEPAGEFHRFVLVSIYAPRLAMFDAAARLCFLVRGLLHQYPSRVSSTVHACVSPVNGLINEYRFSLTVMNVMAYGTFLVLGKTITRT